ncbi:MAG: D-alanyl-D-alanine carboxypeptidase [Chloroflexi bacterium]|nr:D-alanyl-D-alanine carboxypeptidase [Chloroflexota bacterium]
MRTTNHLAVLLLLGATTLSGVGARWSVADAAASRPTPSPSPAVGTSLGSGGFMDAIAAPAPPAVRQSGPTNGTTPPTPTVSAQVARAWVAPQPPPERQWVQNFRPTEAFDGSGPSATSLGQLAQWTTLALVEQSNTGRSRLFDPGTGQGTLPRDVWADLTDFGPAGPPQPDYSLPSGGSVDPSTGRQAPVRQVASWPQPVSAEAAVVVDGDSGAVLFGKNPHERLPMASLTKIMTAIVAVEKGNPRDEVHVTIDSAKLARETESTVMGLMPGDVVSLETLLYGLMLPSGNDAAIEIARHIGGSEQQFAELMNAKAREIGLQDSQFKNPHGLDTTGHYSSAYDLAVMARYGMQYPLFQSLAATRHWQAEGYNLWNLNKLLGVYPGADGVKVGFTDNAGPCLVASATRNGHRVFTVVLHSMNATAEDRALLDYAFDGFRWP